MQISRLFEIVYLLLDKKSMTANQLASHFQVSSRTILRDIDTLSGAGIPIYTTQGKGGGISIIDSFVLNKAVLTDEEQQDILSALQGLKTVEYPNSSNVLSKIETLFNKNNVSWIDIDFSPWGSNNIDKENFTLLRDAIVSRKTICFDYYNYYDEKSHRVCEPIQIIFKERSWYLSAFCKVKNDYRFFKLSRLHNLLVTEATFESREIKVINEFFTQQSFCTVTIKIDNCMHYRVRDEFPPDNIYKDVEGNFTVKTLLPDDEWGYDFILSYGDKAEIIEPYRIRQIIKEKLKLAIKKYL